MRNRIVDDLGMISVRNIQINAKDVDDVESEYGAELVPDSESDLLRTLDLTLQKYRLANKKDPDIVILTDHTGEFFKHMVLNIDFLGASIPGAYNKPAWFRFRKQYMGYNKAQNGRLI